MGSLTNVSDVAGVLGDFVGYFKDGFGALDYFTGGDFAEALAKGFMR